MKYPQVTDMDIAFGIVPSKKLVLKAETSGFYSGHTKYNDLFSSLFFNGGKVVYKKGVSKDVLENSVRYLKAVMVSFGSKHEDKEAVCAMILSEISEV